jgi:hypothetical protein
MSRLATPAQRRPRCAAASANFDDSYQIDPDLSIIKCYYRNQFFIPKCISSATSAAIRMPRRTQPQPSVLRLMSRMKQPGRPNNSGSSTTLELSTAYSRSQEV